MTFDTDLEYWGIDKLLLNACCEIRHYPEMEARQREYERSMKIRAKEEKRRAEENFGQSYIARCRKVIWNLTEYPDSSTAARVITNYLICI